MEYINAYLRVFTTAIYRLVALAIKYNRCAVHVPQRKNGTIGCYGSGLCQTFSIFWASFFPSFFFFFLIG